MKAFAFGAGIGATLCFAAIHVTDSRLTQTGTVQRVPAGSIEPASVRGTEPIQMLEKSETAERSGSQASSSGPSLANEPCISIENLSEEDARAISQRAYQLQQQRERATKDAEPKDASWAYSTEMLIRQHIESHLLSNQYSTLTIECRTTFCELKMTGTGTQGRDVADRLAKEIARQPWSDIAQKGAGGGSNGDTWHLEYEWYRPRTDSERKAWFGLRDPQ